MHRDRRRRTGTPAIQYNRSRAKQPPNRAAQRRSHSFPPAPTAPSIGTSRCKVSPIAARAPLLPATCRPRRHASMHFDGDFGAGLADRVPSHAWTMTRTSRTWCSIIRARHWPFAPRPKRSRSHRMCASPRCAKNNSRNALASAFANWTSRCWWNGRTGAVPH